jgi:hypothetical protein
VARVAIASLQSAYATVFAIEAAIFLIAAGVALRLDARNAWSAVGLPELLSRFSHPPVDHRAEVEGRP